MKIDIDIDDSGLQRLIHQYMKQYVEDTIYGEPHIKKAVRSIIADHLASLNFEELINESLREAANDLRRSR